MSFDKPPFVQDFDEARDHIIFSAYMHSLLRKAEHADFLEDVKKDFQSISSDPVFLLYGNMAKRVLDLHIEKTLEKEAMLNAENSEMMKKIETILVERSDYIVRRFDPIEKQLTIRSQIFVSALSGLIVGGFVIISTFVPSAFGELHRWFFPPT